MSKPRNVASPAMQGAAQAHEIEALRRQLEAARQQRDDALRFMSHDMRAPQSSILTLIELRQLGADETRDTELLLKRIGGYARTALSLSEDFLQLASAEAARYELHEEDLHLLLENAAAMAWPAARARGVRLLLPEEPAPAWCSVDHSLVTRAFANLLNHAVQFSPDGTAVRADIAPAGAGGSHWQVSVRDEGPGIPVSEIDTLFDKFHRSSGDASLRRAGQEFALALVKTVVQGHGGSVVALNVMSHGLETRVCLPAGRRSTR